MSPGKLLLVSAAVGFVVSVGLVPLLVRFAVGRKLLDMPNLRSSHEVPTPRLGGAAVILGTWIGAAVGGLQGGWPILLAASAVGLVGLADDLSGLHFGLKAGVQALAAAALVLLFPPPLLSEAPAVLGAVVFLVGVFWIVALTNAFNFMDGIDGITGGVALVSGTFLFVLSGGGFLSALVGATFGFLVWNVSPASIFLGDAGSYFAGFALAAAALYVPQEPGGWNVLPFFGCVLVFTPYLFDTAFTILRRLRSGVGRGVFSAHREHIYQRITPTTSGHRRTSNLYYGLAAASGVAGVLVSWGGTFAFGGVALALGCCGVMLALPGTFGRWENGSLLDSRGEKQ